MSLIKLTENLENFKWTEYEKAGEGRSPQLDGTDYFERPNPKSLDQMESKFGPINRSSNRGPYSITDYMDGTKQGRGFTAPGQAPLGFTVDMESLTGEVISELDIDGSISLTPLSYVVAGVNSNGPHGTVPEHTIDIQFGSSWLNPVAPNAWAEDFMTLPLAEYVSQYTIEQNDSLITRTFNVPDAYPDTSRAYSVNSQFGWAWPEGSEYLGIHGMPWRGFKLTTTVGEQMDIAGLENVVPEWYPSPPSQVSHPVNHIYLNSEPSPAPSYLEMQFLINYGVTDGIWPYKVLGFEGTHPLIRKDIGERYEIGGVENWMAIQAMRTGDDMERIGKWLETPAGEQWQITQNTLQDLNPREETRLWNRDSITLSIAPLIHAKRHFGGETYMDVADFGPLFSADEPSGITLGGLLGAKFPKLAGKLKTASEGFDSFMEKFDKLNTFLGNVDFNAEGAGGRLRFLRNRFILGDTDKDSTINLGGLGDISLTALRSKSAPFGRPPKIPTQTTFSQRGVYGQGSIHQQTAETGIGGNQIQRYKALAYGELGRTYLPHSSPFPSHGRGGAYSVDDIVGAYTEMTKDYNDLTDDQFDGLEADFKEAYHLYYKDRAEIDQLDKAVKAYGEKIRGAGNINHQIGDPGKQSVLVPVTDLGKDDGAGLGIIKKNIGSTGTLGEGYKSVATDKINIHPYGKDLPNDVSDFIKFKFKDLVNDRFIIFRAILSGISDSITPEWTGTRYIGRPDQVYVYTGTERKVSFNFEIYPKTKQEFPVLMEKLNYLIGLCYPSFTGGNRMVAPFIQLTLGDMFKDSPGFLDSLSVEVDDTGTWEIEDGLQFPKHITCNCSFTYVGKYMPSTLGKHYELGWLDDKGWTADQNGSALTKGTFESDNENPTRINFGGKNKTDYNMNKLFSNLGAANAESV